MYGDYLRWDRLGGVKVGHVGAEWPPIPTGLHWRVSLESSFPATASAVIGGLIETVNLTTRMFDKINLAYDLTDDLKFSIGHRYYGGKNALSALGGEWSFAHFNNVSPALFVEGRVGDHDANSVWGGVRVYFGQKAKSLIRRHREDDPPVGLQA